MRSLFIQECCLASAWYEVLSVVHMMAMLALFEANLILIPKNGQAGGERKVSEGLFILLLLQYCCDLWKCFMLASMPESVYGHSMV